MAKITPTGYFTNWENLTLLGATRDIRIGLTKDEKVLIASQIADMLANYYAHLPQKMSAYGIDPVQSATVLTDLAKTMSEVPISGSYNPDIVFFQSLFKLLNSLHDRHTYFTMPQPWASMIALLPFTLEPCFEEGRRKYILTKIATELNDPDFVSGVEITHWCGIPMALYMANLAKSNNGSYFEAQSSLAVSNLTIRSLAYLGYPDEDWVTLTYFSNACGFKSITVPWKVYVPQPQSAAANAMVHPAVSSGVAPLRGVDMGTLIAKGVMKDFFSKTRDYTVPDDGAAPVTAAKAGKTYFIPPPAGVTNLLSANLAFGTMATPSGHFGYMRIYNFECEDYQKFIIESSNILQNLPQNGLIIDVRSNPGGVIPCGEGLAQLLTSKTIQSLPCSFKNSVYLQKVVDGGKDFFAQWEPSINMLVRTGQAFTQGFGVTPSVIFEALKKRGYYYPGKIVLIIDGLCYSTTDFFASVFQDFGIGKIIGTDGWTGGGGANVWQYDLLSYYMQQAGEAPLPTLPRGAGLSLSMRNALREGPNRGIPLEGLGVKADIRYKLTKNDVLNMNVDLIAFAGKTLSEM